MRGAFVATPVVVVPQDFEHLVTYQNNGNLHNVKLVDCRDPSNFGSLDGFKKQLVALGSTHIVEQLSFSILS